MKLQGSGLFHPKTLQSQNCQSAENRLSLNGLEFVHGQLIMDSGLAGCRPRPGMTRGAGEMSSLPGHIRSLRGGIIPFHVFFHIGNRQRPLNK